MAGAASTAGLVVLALALSGCFFFQQCGFRPEGAVWHQPGLYELVPATMEGRPVAVVSPDTSPYGWLYPWTSPFGPANITALHLRPADFAYEIWIEEGPTIAGRFHGTAEASIPGLFERFAENVTDGSKEEIGGWAAAFVATQRADREYGRPDDPGPSYVHHVAVGERIDLDGHPVLEHGVIDPMRQPQPGHPYLGWGDWSASLIVPVKEWSGELRVDPYGQTEYRGRFDVGESRGEGHPRYEEEVRDRMDALGLPGPTGEMHLQGSIC